MLILALDTSTTESSFAVRRDDETALDVRLDRECSRGDVICQVVRDRLRDEGLAVHDFDGFAACVGPGSFTGLRVGLALAKTLAFVRERPLFGLDSVRLVAERIALGQTPIETKEFTAAVIGFKDTVFRARYRLTDDADEKALEALGDLEWDTGVDGLVARSNDESVVLAHGQAERVAASIAVPTTPTSAAVLATASMDRLRRGEIPDPTSIQPRYLKPFGVGKRAPTLEDMR